MKLQYREFFSETISNLGFQIYDHNKVVRILNSGSVINAEVIDHNIYHVKIEYDKNIINKMTCTCAYSDLGYYCMHMAAVCIHLENYQLKQIKNRYLTTGILNENVWKEVSLGEIDDNNLTRKHDFTLHEKVKQMDVQLFPSTIENDLFFSGLVKYADLLLQDGEKKEHVLSLMEKYKRDYSIFKWIIDFSHLNHNQLLEIQMIEEGIVWSKSENDISHLNSFYKLRKDFYHSL